LLQQIRLLLVKTRSYTTRQDVENDIKLPG
jgi:hypothetical protein